MSAAEPCRSAEPLPHWISPHRQAGWRIVKRVEGRFDAPTNSFELALDYLLGHDHHRRRDAERMAALEARLLGRPGMVPPR